MVPSIARQSVIIKCNQQTSVLLGNYEFYYLAGLTKKLFGFDLSEDLEPVAMLEQIHAQQDTANPSNAQEEYLLKLVKNYKPLEDYNEQTKELFRWGETEEHLWKVNIS
ncbi:MAG: DUF3837 domain-containing protein [Lachnospiraceae bacterium]|nr:DUF3837 domain-containing protein [Lachnospiraceae bacterium]